MKRLNRKSHNYIGLYIFLLVAAVMAMMAIRSRRYTANRHAADPAAGDTIVAAIQYSPMTFYMHADTLGGFDYDLLRLIGRQKDVTFKFVPVTTVSEGFNGLRDGRYDILAADITLTAALRDSFLVTEPAYTDRQILVQTATGPDKKNSVLDLRDDTVWVAAGTSSGARIANLEKEIGDTIHVITTDDTPEQLFIRTAIGEIPRSVINEKTAQALHPAYPDADISTTISLNRLQPWFVAENNVRLRDSLDSWLKAAEPTAAYGDLVERYLR